MFSNLSFSSIWPVSLEVHLVLWFALSEFSVQRKEMGFLYHAPVLVVEKGTFVSCL